MGDLFQPMHIIILLVIFLLICLPFLIAAILYLLTLQKTLRNGAPSSRTLEPGMVWLFLIPLVNLIFNFFIVFGLAKSLHNEFVKRGIPVADPTPGQSIGLAMCICACCVFIPILGILAGIANLVLWIMYWVKIAEYSRLLDTYPEEPLIAI